MGKVALITGCTSQDGSYLSETLLENDYKVYGLVRRTSENLWRLDHIKDKLELVNGDMTDQSSLDNAIKLIKPDEVYNLAAQSSRGYSMKVPIATCDVTAMGVLRLLEAIRTHKKDTKVFQASSSEIFGDIQRSPQTVETPMSPRSPYGCAKAFAQHICINYRKMYGMFISCGILYNHESPRRGTEFVTRKITQRIAGARNK